MFRQEFIYRYIRTIERLFLEDNLIDTDYYKMYAKTLEREDLEYILSIGLNSKRGELIRYYMRQLDEWFKSK